MFTHETFQAQMSVLVEAAVCELRISLDECTSMAMQSYLALTSHITVAKNEEENSDVILLEGTQQFINSMTRKFASRMEAWTKGAVEKITSMLRISLAESESSPHEKVSKPRSTKAQTLKLDHGPIRTDDVIQQKENPVSQPPPDEPLPAKPPADEPLPVKPPADEPLLIEPLPIKTLPGKPLPVEPLPVKPLPVKTLPIKPLPIKTLPVKPLPIKTLPDEPLPVKTLPDEPVNTSSQPDSEHSDDGDNTADDVNDSLPERTNQSSAGNRATVKRKRTSRVDPIKCPSCDKTFALKCWFDRHFLTHSKPHLCSQCGKRFARPEGLAAHSRQHTGEKLFKCSQCNTEFAYKSTFSRHMRQHQARNTLTCAFCEVQFPGAPSLQKHKCLALATTFGCSLCPETFACRKSLADHEDRHQGDRDFVCEVCGERFLSPASLSTHRVGHMQRDVCCAELGLGCSHASVLQTHLSKHTGEKRFPCGVCGKGCSHPSALKHHMLTHTGERLYVCETCGKRCGHASALQNHMRIHTGQKPGQRPVCNVCGKCLSSMVNLRYHMSVHTGERPFACEQCGKKFRNPTNLKIHAITHTGVKLYGCTICGRRFTTARSLKSHRQIHTGERPYRCTDCGKVYSQQAEFRKHQAVHMPTPMNSIKEAH